MTVLLVGDAAALRGEAAQALRDLRDAGVRCSLSMPRCWAALMSWSMRCWASACARRCSAAVAGRHRGHECLRACPCLALDLPSGLDPDSGRALPAVQATATITFIALKQGCSWAMGRSMPASCISMRWSCRCSHTAAAASLQRLTDAALAAALPPRPRQSHKGQFGRVLIIGGGAGMPGAVRLAGEAALRVGAGLVTVASLPEHLEAVVGARPELMFRALRSDAACAGGAGRRRRHRHRAGPGSQ